MIDALKNELGSVLRDESYISGITDVLARQMLKSLKKAVKDEISEGIVWIRKNKGKIIIAGIGLAMIIKIIRRA